MEAFRMPPCLDKSYTLISPLQQIVSVSCSKSTQDSFCSGIVWKEHKGGTFSKKLCLILGLSSQGWSGGGGGAGRVSPSSGIPCRIQLWTFVILFSNLCNYHQQELLTYKIGGHLRWKAKSFTGRKRLRRASFVRLLLLQEYNFT